MSVGSNHTVGLRANGTVVAVGASSARDVGACDVEEWTSIVDVRVSAGFIVGLRSDGTVVAAGVNTDGECNVWDWANIKLPNRN